jgi:cobaltochelatase CobS
MASAAEINAIARDIKRDAPAINTGTRLGMGTRSRLEDLAYKAGLAYGLCARANDNDLISVYLVALKDGEAAKRTAQKVAMRLDDTLLGSPEPEPTPEPAPAPTPPTAPPSVDMAAIRTLIRQEVKDGALDPLQHALDATFDQLSRRIDETAAEVSGDAVSRLLPVLEKMATTAATEALKALTPTRLEIVQPGEPVRPLGLVHRGTAEIISALSTGVNVYLHGPAGSGKTTVGRKCAEAFGLQFYFAAKVESEYQLMGFKDAKGDTVRTPFREAYEHGGMFLFDELDASSSSAVVALNAALANGIAPFPDAIITRHKDFYCIAAGNTKLTGASRQYTGRNQLDAASIDRFSFIEFGYDDDLERALATDQAWCAYVQLVRKAVADRGLNHLVTPRATYDGCKLLAAGFDVERVKAMCVYKGLDADTVRQIEQAVRA